MIAVVYARFSSDLQRDASIEDQIRLCRERIECEGWHFLHAYTDRAISGSSALRPAYQRLPQHNRRRGGSAATAGEAAAYLRRDFGFKRGKGNSAQCSTGRRRRLTLLATVPRHVPLRRFW